MMQNINAQLAAGKVSLCDPLARIKLRNTQSYMNGNTYDAKYKCATLFLNIYEVAHNEKTRYS